MARSALRLEEEPMPWYDLPEEQLKDYRTGTQEPAEVAIEVPRPPYWGGFALAVEAIELWVEGEFRIHDRARWTRERRAAPQTSTAAAAAAPAARPRWTATRLQP